MLKLTEHEITIVVGHDGRFVVAGSPEALRKLRVSFETPDPPPHPLAVSAAERIRKVLGT